MHGGVVHLWEHRESQRQIVELQMRLSNALKAYDYIIERVLASAKLINELGDQGPLIACDLHDAIEDSNAIKITEQIDVVSNN
jgi:hypothetical protein